MEQMTLITEASSAASATSAVDQNNHVQEQFLSSFIPWPTSPSPGHQQQLNFSNSGCLFAAYGFELCLHLAEVPISLLNLLLVARTSVIHPNLKHILIYQSCCFLLRDFSRGVICVNKFLAGDAILEQPNPRLVYFVSIYARNFLAHILILERLMATVLVESYERRRGFQFTLVWAPLVLGAAFFNAIADYLQPNAKTAFVFSVAMLALALLELIIFVGLCRYNQTMYWRYSNSQKHNLSLKYQLSENIRIGKQLVPTLVLHSWTLLTTAAVFTSLAYGSRYSPVVLAFTTITNTICGLLIEITTITQHPFLLRSLCFLLDQNCWHIPTRLKKSGNRIGANGRKEKEEEDEGEEMGQGGTKRCSSSNKNIAMRDIHGRQLVKGRRAGDGEPEQHFAMLKKQWEQV